MAIYFIENGCETHIIRNTTKENRHQFWMQYDSHFVRPLLPDKNECKKGLILQPEFTGKGKCLPGGWV